MPIEKDVLRLAGIVAKCKLGPGANYSGDTVRFARSLVAANTEISRLTEALRVAQKYFLRIREIATLNTNTFKGINLTVNEALATLAATTQPEAPIIADAPKRCAERMDSFPFSSDHVWPCHQRVVMPSRGDCLNCGCSYAEYNSRFDAARIAQFEKLGYTNDNQIKR